MMSDLKRKTCVLCKEPAERTRPWDAAWDRKCAASICKLLEVDQEDLPVLFENFNYCLPCHEFIRDIDCTVQTLTSLQEKSQELRTIVSQMILPNLDLFCASGDEEDETEYLSANNSGSDSSENKAFSGAVESCTRQNSTRTAFTKEDSVTIDKIFILETEHQDHTGDVTDETTDQIKLEYDEHSFVHSARIDAESNVLVPAEHSKAEAETTVQASLRNDQFPGHRRTQRQRVSKNTPRYQLFSATEENEKDSYFVLPEADSDHHGSNSSCSVMNSVANCPNTSASKRSATVQAQSSPRKQIKNTPTDDPVGSVTFSCPVCKKGFATKPRLAFHIKCWHLEAEKFPCKICEWVFYFEEDRKAHEKLHQPNVYACVLGKCYYFKVRKDYGSLDELRLHLKEVHEFQCEICGFMAVNKPVLKVHKLMHTKEKPFPCKICGGRFRTKHHLELHTESRHPDQNNVKVYSCQLCHETFRSRNALYSHRSKSHSGPNTSVFQSCSYAQAQRSSLYKIRTRPKTQSDPS